MKKVFVTILFLLVCIVSFTQKIEPSILHKRWTAQWISVPKTPSDGYGVYLFRKNVDISKKPDTFVIHVSADNRYKLYVNETLVSMGPARGDLNHWNFETIDIAPFLKEGKNIVAAQVWNEAEYRPEAQISYQSGFILQGSSESSLNTNSSWKCMQDSSYAPTRGNPKQYYVAGPGELRRMAFTPKNWQNINFDDSKWLKPKSIGNGTPKDLIGPFGSPNGWMLTPSGIPAMELTEERISKVVKIDGNIVVPDNFLQKPSDLIVPANTTVQLLLDQSYLTNAYPNLLFSGGENATITLIYAEALYDKNGGKGNRNDVEQKTILGRTDQIISDGSEKQHFTPLAYRTYRYIQLKISTQNTPIKIHDVYGIFTGYPFKFKANLTDSSPEMNKILEIGWRTARLCAVETYMDCPYYEQLQYIGDARIQALITMYNSGDERMVKNALQLMDNSRQPEGVTLSRHPSYTPQFIPTFSLWYIGMLHDYAKYGSDLEFIKNKLSGTRQILSYFKNYQQADGSLKNVPQWMFTDWVDNFKDWQAGVAPIGKDGYSAAVDMQLLLAYQTAADLESKLGIPAMAGHYQGEIEKLKQTIKYKYWDISSQLFADRTEKDVFSQHTNALAILTGLVNKKEAQALAMKILSTKTLAPASIYFKYYLHQALVKAGLGNGYLQWLDKWRENIDMGLTTWGETSDVDKTRSDCHAWGASPNIEFFRTILGIDSDAMGFSEIRLEPHLGDIKKIGGSMPHPKGNITVHYSFKGNKLVLDANLPIAGKLVWKGKNIPLKIGKQTLICD